ncbi:uncharacterized protein LOC114742677 [Neltuma alba]|uniref:uncharacterized protein LOC114714905 n=1 Tax=Neltuma alba TaxID=207710 RepID=UPI0010A32007|nr:uncharacterized protein LOC114714905 [Prosopis alba]XP_028786736.1 uncharacterized protein LOC114742677 [Prosopis alba]
MASSVEEFMNKDIHSDDLAITPVDPPPSPQHHEHREAEEPGIGDTAIKVHGRKRKSKGVPHDDRMAKEEKLVKRIILSLTKPSYVLGLCPHKLRSENQYRLRIILQRLVKQQKWGEASGVLSVYLQATVKEKSPFDNQFKFWVLLEFLKHVENSRISPTRIKNIYDVWMRKNGSMKYWPVENRFAVHLEFILFFIMQGNIEEAYQAVLCLKQENGSDHDFMANMMMGLVFYELWYSCIPKEFQWRDLDEIDSPRTSYIEGDEFSNQRGQSEWHNTVETHIGEAFYKCDSNSSVCNDKKISVDAGVDQDMSAPMEINVDHQREKPLSNFQPQGFYMDSEEHTENGDSDFNNRFHMQDASSLYALGGLDSELLPLHLPDHHSLENFIFMHNKLLNGYFRDAVKYLQRALDSTPSALAALLPLIQLLLIGGQVDEALNILEKQCRTSDSALPFRLKAILLERLKPNNSLLLASCFEDTLKKDRTCCESLAKLVKLHLNGHYNVESLVEMIASHLDATDAEHYTWKVFASCFLILFSYEEDCMSTCVNDSEDELRKHVRSFPSGIPKVFTEKPWKVRSRWWKRRHFGSKNCKSEIQAGDLQLLTYKAACASYIYGREFPYVVKAHSHLEEQNEKDLLSLLDNHRYSSYGFYKNLT